MTATIRSVTSIDAIHYPTSELTRFGDELPRFARHAPTARGTTALADGARWEIEIGLTPDERAILDDLLARIERRVGVVRQDRHD